MRVKLFPSVKVGLAATGAYIAFVYATLPLTPLVVNAIYRSGYLKAVIAFIGISVATFLFMGGINSGRIKRVSCWLAYGWIVLVYYLASEHTVGLAERLHLWLYALLGFLLFSLLRFWLQKKALAAGVLIFTTLFGTIDEGIQYLLPNRHFSVDDIILNCIGGVTALVVTRFILGDEA